MMRRIDLWKRIEGMPLRNRRGAMTWALVLLAIPGCELTMDMAGEPTPDTFASAQPRAGGVQHGTALAQRARLAASAPEPGDRFGWSVAVSGDTLAVGASQEGSRATGVDGDEDDDRAPGSGAVYVFRRQGTAWAQEAYLKASNTEPGDRFGWSVAMAGDTLAVGAVWEDSSATGVSGQQRNNRAPESGAVYVFRRQGTAWAQEAYLKASNTGEGDYFGHAVALAGDGDTLVVGAYREDGSGRGTRCDQDDDGAPDSGAVYVFRRQGTTWAQEAYLKASNSEPLDEFGRSVAIDGSGDTLVAGAYHEDSRATGVDGDEDDDRAPGSGAVYVFRRQGAAWAQEAYLKASNTGAGDWFGRSVAIAGDTVAVGALLEDSSATGVNGQQRDDSAPESGAVYVFRRQGTAWAQEAYLKASNTGAEDRFGVSVALARDTLAVGAAFESSSATGVGGDEHDDGAPNSGAVYLFSRTGASWTQEAYIKASHTKAGDELGYCLALSDDDLAVGAAFADGSVARPQEGITSDWDAERAADSGAVYVFD